jgi:hypothetical protein
MILDAQVDEIVIVHIYIFKWLIAVVLVSKGNAGRVDRKEHI